MTNKEYVDKTYPKALPVDTISDVAVASFEDGADGTAVTSFKVAITLVQSGSGDPSPDNIRPISGWSEVNVFRTGRNMFDEATAVLYDRFINVNATPKLWSYSASSKSIAFPCKPNTTYSVSCLDPDAETVITVFRVGWIESGIPSGISVSPTIYGVFDVGASGTATLTTGANATYIIVQINAAILSARTSHLQIELGSTATNYELYTGTTYSITIPTPPDTVYGGTFDLTTGVLTVTHANIASYNGETINEPWISSKDVYTLGATPTTGAQVVYPLTSPQTYQLTPTEVKTLLADNTIWADCGNINALTYRADPTLYNEKEIEKVETIITPNVSKTMTAPTNLSEGDLVIAEHNLYKATTAIVSGAALVPNTNVVSTSMAAELSEIRSLL